MKTCSKCGKALGLSFFRLCTYSNGTTYYKSVCKECEKEYAREYVGSHREERSAYQKDFVTQNPQYIRSWKLKNREKIRKQERNRRATDANFKLKKNVSRAISHVMKKGGETTFKYLPYTVQELKEHLEKQFDSHMTWENYGTYWHVDHIVPHSTFQYTLMKDESFQKCWGLSNLRPLEAKQNQSDGATRIRHRSISKPSLQ